MFNYFMQCHRCGRECGCNKDGYCDKCVPADTPMFAVRQAPFKPCTLEFEFNGAKEKFDFTNLIHACETNTKLDVDECSKSLIYYGERSKERINGSKLGKIIGLGDLFNVAKDANDPQSCGLLVARRGCAGEGCDECDDSVDSDESCDECGKGDNACDPVRWQVMNLKDPGDCLMTPNDDGSYTIMTIDKCGCPKVCRIPMMGQTYTGQERGGVGVGARDSFFSDADQPLTYGSYTDDFALRFDVLFPDIYGKFAIDYDVDFQVQTFHPNAGLNNHVTASIAPYQTGELPDIVNPVWIEQWNDTFSFGDPTGMDGSVDIPWATQNVAGHISGVLDKGKDLNFHFELGRRLTSSFPQYWDNPYDGQDMKPEEAGLDMGLTNSSRLYAIKIKARPTIKHAVPDNILGSSGNIKPGATLPPISEDN